MSDSKESRLVPQWGEPIMEDDGGRHGLFLRRAENLISQHEIHYIRNESGKLTATLAYYYCDVLPDPYPSEEAMLAAIEDLLAGRFKVSNASTQG